MAERFTFRDFGLDPRERRLSHRGGPIHIEPKSFDLLHYLVRNAGKLNTKQALIDAVWKGAAVSDNALTRSVHQIRTALGDDAAEPRFIETVAGSGYRFIAPVVVARSEDEQAARPEAVRRPASPLAAAAALILTLVVATVWFGLEALSPASGPVQRLAVLPLVNLTGDVDRQYLVQGVHESLTAALSRMRTVDVISRTSVMRYQGSDTPLSEIARDLDVDAVIEGSVMLEGDRLRVTAQLIATAPERHLWAQSFERNVAEIFDVGPEIARSVASEVGVALQPPEPDVLANVARPFDPRAYDDFLRARFHFERKTPKDYSQAQELFRHATELDPQFAAAYVGLAHTYGSAAVWGIEDPAVAMPLARSLAQQALALDPGLADADLILAGVDFYWDWDVDASEARIRRVLERNSDSAHAYRLLSEILSVSGRGNEALAVIERARELDPLSPTAQLKPAFTRYLLRDYEEAIRLARAGQSFYPEFWQGYWVLCLSLSATGRYDEAVTACETAVEYSGGASIALGGLGYALAKAGAREDAVHVITKLQSLRTSRYVGAANLAIIFGALGETDPAFAELEQAYENRDWLLVHMKQNAVFDSLRSDTRFEAFGDRTPPLR